MFNWKDVTFGQIFGAVIAAVLILFLAVILFTANQNNRMSWVGLYVVVALVTGTTFWVINPLEKQGFSWSQLGIQFGGAAAIGAGFMALAHQFTPPPQASSQLISLDKIDEKFRERLTFRLTNTFSGLAEPPILIPPRGTPTKALVEFKEGANSAKFQVVWDVPPQGNEKLADFEVDRDGVIVHFAIRDK
jgi:hypothetical protein